MPLKSNFCQHSWKKLTTLTPRRGSYSSAGRRQRRRGSTTSVQMKLYHRTAKMSCFRTLLDKEEKQIVTPVRVMLITHLPCNGNSETLNIWRKKKRSCERCHRSYVSKRLLMLARGAFKQRCGLTLPGFRMLPLQKLEPIAEGSPCGHTSWEIRPLSSKVCSQTVSHS